jgi:putative addiction module killer protein
LIRILEYLDSNGRSAHARWLESLSLEAAAKVSEALYRLSQGNFSKVKGIGSGVFERKIDFGPGYRIYFGKDGEMLVILLGGSSKQNQQEAIAAAHRRWVDYRRRVR